MGLFISDQNRSSNICEEKMICCLFPLRAKWRVLFYIVKTNPEQIIIGISVELTERISILQLQSSTFTIEYVESLDLIGDMLHYY